jgi:acyl carrier protein
MSDVKERVKQLVAKHFGVSEVDVTESASFTDDLNADSLDTVEFMMAIEEEFEVEVPDEEAQKIHTLKDAVAFIERLKAAA